MKWQHCVSVMVGLVLAVTASAAWADVFNMGAGLKSLDFVTVGNAGNANDSRLGGVDHVYAIGKYEVTAGQYTAFLNAAAKTDTYGLYTTNMTSTYGCQIVRSGSSGSYTYSVATDRANRPVNFVNWGDAARFMNWLHNGQGNVSTETGAYELNGATSDLALMAITRNADAKFWIPTYNEWYKAAYHKNNGVTGDYWDYPTSGDSINTSMANYGNVVGNTTDVGAYPNASSYGTFDQGGNVMEWNETAVTSSSRGLLGGSWNSNSSYLRASATYLIVTAPEGSVGFRVASVPEPGSLTLMFCGGLAGLYWWRRRK